MKSFFMGRLEVRILATVFLSCGLLPAMSFIALQFFGKKDFYSGQEIFFIGLGALVSPLLAFFLLRAPLRQVREISEKLAGHSSEVGDAVSRMFSLSQDLSLASTKQSAAVHQTAAAIEEITAMVQKSSDNAVEVERTSSKSKSSADRGCEIVGQMVSSMSEINHRNEQVAEAVHAGNQKISEIVTFIQEIGAKTKVIDEIVFQTKLLSFNASVEAARAGEYGKGFAVVAQEVGNLASMSGKASEEITKLLQQGTSTVKKIVEETKESVQGLIESSKIAIEEGAKVAHECEAILSEIVSSSSEVSEMVAGIALASQEQARGVSEISEAIQMIDKTTKVAAASANSCANSADHLAEKVKGLRATSAEFRLFAQGKFTVTKFKWVDEYQLNVKEMDEEHKVLIEKMNALAEAFELPVSSKRNRAIKEKFDDLASFTQAHFSDEESYMESIGFPDLNKHREIHKKLLSLVGEFGLKVQEGQCEGTELMDFLNDWLMKHILGSDMRYGEYSVSQSLTVDQERVAS